MSQKDRLTWSLLLLRLGVFIVMLMWTLDKFVRPEHASSVYEHFYFLGGLGPALFYILGFLELILILVFVTGSWKRISYGLVMVLHGMSTLSSFGLYLDPFDNLLFFTAWPMLAACIALYLLRDSDTCGTLALGEKKRD